MARAGRPLPHPALAEVHKTLQRNYTVQFSSFGLMQYRNGRDGQAFHRDTDMRWLDDTVIAVLTFGAKRPWLLRPRTNRYDHGETRGATHDVQPGGGDLLVMGGRCQADWEHSVAYMTRQHVGVRISLQWRYAHAARRGPSWVRPTGRRSTTHDRDLHGLWFRQRPLAGQRRRRLSSARSASGGSWRCL